MARRATKKKKDLTPEEKLAQALVPVEEWPYRVPENWCWVKLGKSTEIIMGQSPKGTATTDDSSFVPLVGGAADMGDLYPRASRYTKEPTKTSIENDIIICIRATLGRPIFSDGVYCLGRGVAAVRTHTMDREYIRYGLVNFEQYLYDNATGTTFAQVSSAVIEKMPFPLPPLPEQQRIVARIESLFAKLDEAKEKAQAVVDGFEERKAAILHKAFTGELTSVWDADSTSEVLSSIMKWSEGLSQKDIKVLQKAQSEAEDIVLPDGRKWIKCTVGAIGKVSNGSTPSRKIAEYWNGDIPWVSSGEVRNNYVSDTIECITKRGFDNSAVRLLPVGTVLIAMIGEGKTRGQSAILGIEATINQNIAAISIDHGMVLPEFLWYWFQMNYSKNREKGAGSGPQALNCQRVRELDFVCPSVREQYRIVSILKSLLEKENQAKSTAEQVLDQIDTMKKAILARAFRGELGTNDPAEESAVELLKRML